MKAEDICSIESEAGIIATLIHNPEFTYYSEHLLPNHFTKKDNQCVYTAICELTRRGVFQIDAYNVLEILNSMPGTKKLAEEITLDKLNELIEMSDVIARSTIEEYKILVGNVLDTAFRRDTFRKLKECQALCYSGHEENIQQKIYNMIDDVMTEFSVAEELPELGEIIDDVWEDIQTHQDGREAGIPFKFPTLNEYVTIEPGELVVLGAPQKERSQCLC